MFIIIKPLIVNDYDRQAELLNKYYSYFGFGNLFSKYSMFIHVCCNWNIGTGLVLLIDKSIGNVTNV